ncbi:MAG: hypothetical protein ACPLRW_09395 [Moorellales bacterium]
MSARAARGTTGIVLAALLLLGLAAGRPAWGQEAAAGGPVTLAVQVGWDGKAVSGQTAPAVVTLENRSSRDLAGVVEAVSYYKEVPPPPPGSPPGTKPGPARYRPASAYGERVSLPAGGRKEVVLWFRLESPDKMLFRFRSGEEVLVGHETSLPGAGLLSGGPLPQAVGVLGPIPPALEKTRILAPDGVPRAPLIIPLTAGLFPEAGEDLDAFRTILVAGGEAANLSRRQRQALAEWVEQGGHLVLSGGLALAASLEALPEGTGEVEGETLVTRRDWRAAAAWLGVAPPPAGAAVVARLAGAGSDWGPNQAPLARKVKLGLGEVTVLAFDPNSPPWNAGDLGQALWKRLLMPASDPSLVWGPPPGAYLAANLAGYSAQLPEEAFPGWRVAGVYLLVFLALAGPATYFLLRWRRRPEYAWIAVPALAVAFAGAVYLYTFQTGRNVLINAVQTVEVGPGARPQVYTGLGFFAPTQPRFTAVLADPGHPVQVQVSGYDGALSGNQEQDPPYSLIRGGDLEITFSRTSQWGMRSLAFRQEAGPELAGLKAELRAEGTRVKARVINGSRLRLDHVTLLLGRNYAVLGELAPGEEGAVELEITPPPNPNQPGYGPPYPESWRIFLLPGGTAAAPAGAASAARTGAGKTRQAQPGAIPAAPPPDFYQGPPRPLTVEEQRRATMLDNWSGQQRRGPMMEMMGWPLAAVAWSRDPAAPVGVKGLRAEPHYLTMVVLRPQLVLPPGPFSLPEGLVVPEVVQANVKSMFGWNNFQGLGGGSVTFAFRPQMGAGARVEEITVHLPYYPVQAPAGGPKGPGGPPSPNPAPVEPGALEIYNPLTGAWEELAGRERFTLPGSYTTAGGEVQLRVNGFEENSGRQFYFLPPRVGYRGVAR